MIVWIKLVLKAIFSGPSGETSCNGNCNQGRTCDCKGTK